MPGFTCQFVDFGCMYFTVCPAFCKDRICNQTSGECNGCVDGLWGFGCDQG